MRRSIFRCHGTVSARRLAALAILAAAVLTGAAVPVAAPVRPAAAACALKQTEPLTQRPWSSQRLDFERVWPLSTGAGVTVGVVDSGVDARHPQLAGHVSAGYSVLDGGRADSDCVGHGTAVAGIIAARQLPGVGFAGVAPGARIVPVRETSEQGNGTVRDLAAGITAAVELGAQVINVSVVTAQDDPALRAAVRAALDRQVVVVAAAGNDFGEGNPVLYPAAYPGVLAVGAIDQSGAASSFSEGGTVGVVAPGSNLISTGAGGTGLVGSQGGTSFAAPFVAGTAALVRAYLPDLTAAQVVHRIEVTADHPAGPLPDPKLGWGVVNPYRAVTAVLPEEDARAGSTSPTSSPVPHPAAAATRPGGGGLALGLAGAAVLLVAAIGALARFLPRGRARGWKPGSWPANPPANPR